MGMEKGGEIGWNQEEIHEVDSLERTTPNYIVIEEGKLM